LNLLISKSEIYRYPIAKVKKEIVFNEYEIGLEVPLKIGETGNLEGIDFSKIKIKPEFSKEKGEKVTNKALNTSLGKENSEAPPAAPAKADPVETAKQKIREAISQNMRAERKKKNADLYAYSARLEAHILKASSPELKNFVIEQKEKELRSIEIEDFTSFRAEILGSKEATKIKLQKIAAFEKQHLTVDKDDLKILRDEVNAQAQPTAAPQTKMEVGQPNDPHEQEADAMADQIMRQDKDQLQTKPLSAGISPIAQRQNITELGHAEQAAPVNSALEKQINATKGSGAPLPPKTRQEMEASFGTDFGGVRTHTIPCSRAAGCNPKWCRKTAKKMIKPPPLPTRKKIAR
jgi:hypothetical protein